jgi:predicted nucleic acid-binding protein
MNGVVLFDTGILLRASISTLDHAELCLALWARAKAGTIQACIAQQSVWEFFSVLTRFRVPHRKVFAEIQKHLAVFPLIAPKSGTFSETLASVGRLRWLNGPQVYDLLLAHTTLDNGVTTLYTLNDRHFRKFGLPLHIVNPASRAKARGKVRK